MTTKKATKRGAAKPKKAVSHSNPQNVVTQSVCRKFKEVRSQTGLNQEKFGETLGVNLPYIKAIETGHFIPAPTIIVKLAIIYKVDLNWLFGVKEIKLNSI